MNKVPLLSCEMRNWITGCWIGLTIIRITRRSLLCHVTLRKRFTPYQKIVSLEIAARFRPPDTTFFYGSFRYYSFCIRFAKPTNTERHRYYFCDEFCAAHDPGALHDNSQQITLAPTISTNGSVRYRQKFVYFWIKSKATVFLITGN